MCASNPAEIKITSGLNLSIGFNTFVSKILKNSLLQVPAFKVALKIFPTPFSCSAPVPEIKEIHARTRKQLNYLYKKFLVFHFHGVHQNQ